MDDDDDDDDDASVLIPCQFLSFRVNACHLYQIALEDKEED